MKGSTLIIANETAEDLLQRLRHERGERAEHCIKHLLSSYEKTLGRKELEELFERASATEQLEQIAVLYASNQDANKVSLWRMFEVMRCKSFSSTIALIRALLQKADQLTLVEMSAMFEFADTSVKSAENSLTYQELLELGKGIVGKVNGLLHKQSNSR